MTTQDAIKKIAQLQADDVANLVTAVDVITRLEKRISALEEHRDAAVNRIMVLEQQLASSNDRFDAHMELYHSAE